MRGKKKCDEMTRRRTRSSNTKPDNPETEVMKKVVNDRQRKTRYSPEDAIRIIEETSECEQPARKRVSQKRGSARVAKKAEYVSDKSDAEDNFETKTKTKKPRLQNKNKNMERTPKEKARLPNGKGVNAKKKSKVQSEESEDEEESPADVKRPRLQNKTRKLPGNKTKEKSAQAKKKSKDADHEPEDEKDSETPQKRPAGRLQGKGRKKQQKTKNAGRTNGQAKQSGEKENEETDLPCEDEDESDLDDEDLDQSYLPKSASEDSDFEPVEVREPPNKSRRLSKSSTAKASSSNIKKKSQKAKVNSKTKEDCDAPSEATKKVRRPKEPVHDSDVSDGETDYSKEGILAVLESRKKPRVWFQAQVPAKKPKTEKKTSPEKVAVATNKPPSTEDILAILKAQEDKSHKAAPSKDSDDSDWEEVEGL